MRQAERTSCLAAVVLASAGLVLLGGCTEQSAGTPAALLVALPDYCNTPDGMTLQPDGSIILSVPNFNDEKSPPVMMRITPDNKAEKWFDLPSAPGAAENVRRIAPGQPADSPRVRDPPETGWQATLTMAASGSPSAPSRRTTPTARSQGPSGF